MRSSPFHAGEQEMHFRSGAWQEAESLGKLAGWLSVLDKRLLEPDNAASQTHRRGSGQSRPKVQCPTALNIK